MIRSHRLADEVEPGLSTFGEPLLLRRIGTLHDVPRKYSMLRVSQKRPQFPVGDKAKESPRAGMRQKNHRISLKRSKKRIFLEWVQV